MFGWVWRFPCNLSLITLVLLGGWLLPVAAQDNLPKEEDKSFTLNLNLNSLQTSLQWIGSHVDTMAQGVDEYFASDQVSVKPGQSIVKLGISTYISEHSSLQNGLIYSIAVGLPKLQKKLNLYVESAIAPDKNTAQGSAITTTTGNQESNLGLGLLYDINKLLQLKTRSGVNFSGLDLDPYFSIVARYRIPTGLDDIIASIEPEWFWTGKLDTGEQVNLFITYSNPQGNYQNWLFRSSSNILHYDSNAFSTLAQRFDAFQTVNAYNRLNYQLGRQWLYEDELEVSDTYLQLVWRNKLYQDWVFLTVTPGVHYPKTLDYQQDIFLILTLEAYSHSVSF